MIGTELYWLLVLGNLTTPMNWVIGCLAVLAFWRFAHPVGVVMLSSVAATAVLEAIWTGFGFQYGNGDWAYISITSHLVAALVTNAILATLLFFGLRKNHT